MPTHLSLKPVDFVDQVFADIEAASKAHGFGVPHHYDFKQTTRTAEKPSSGW
jgi:phosphopantetheinyl transferase (holo-ACP synthase)